MRILDGDSKKERGDAPNPLSSLLKLRSSELRQELTHLYMEVAGPFAQRLALEAESDEDAIGPGLGGRRHRRLPQQPQGHDLRRHQRGAAQHSGEGRARSLKSSMPECPLEGLRVVELGTGDALAYCGKQFADFGADVIKVEPPGGDPSRALGVLVDAGAGRRESAHFAWLNTNKRSITADLAKSRGRRTHPRAAQDRRPPARRTPSGRDQGVAPLARRLAQDRSGPRHHRDLVVRRQRALQQVSADRGRRAQPRRHGEADRRGRRPADARPRRPGRRVRRADGVHSERGRALQPRKRRAALPHQRLRGDAAGQRVRHGASRWSSASRACAAASTFSAAAFRPAPGKRRTAFSASRSRRRRNGPASARSSASRNSAARRSIRRASTASFMRPS